MATFRMTDSMLIGHEQIDYEHAAIVALLNEACVYKDSGDETRWKSKLLEMKGAIKRHIENEEKIMESLGYSSLETHKIAHAVFMRALSERVTSPNEDGFNNFDGSSVMMLLTDDFLKADAGFAGYLNYIDYKPKQPKS